MRCWGGNSWHTHLYSTFAIEKKTVSYLENSKSTALRYSRRRHSSKTPRIQKICHEKVSSVAKIVFFVNRFVFFFRGLWTMSKAASQFSVFLFLFLISGTSLLKSSPKAIQPLQLSLSFGSRPCFCFFFVSLLRSRWTEAIRCTSWHFTVIARGRSVDR